MEKMIPIFASDKNHCPLVAKQNAHNKWELWHLSEEKEAKYDFRVFKEHEYDAVEVTNSTTGRALIKVLKDGEWREIVFIQPTRLQENKAKTLLLSCQRCYDVIASLRSNPESSNKAWIASSYLLAMTEDFTFVSCLT